MIPRINISALFDGPSQDRDETDKAIIAASSHNGFMTVTGLPKDIPLDNQARKELLRLFDLPEVEQKKLWRKKFNSEQPYIYRGWFPRQESTITCKEGMDIGPDVAHGANDIDPTDPLQEQTPMPDEHVLPGWRHHAATYYRGMEKTAQVMMRSIARGLGIGETIFDGAFYNGNSTLRIIHYPIRSDADLQKVTDPNVWITHHGQRTYVCGKAHVDSGFVTLLAQDGVAGLQARAVDGEWLDVPPAEGTLAVNFGKLLDRWTGGRIKATEHRVIGTGRQRCSIPFFYEPRVDAVIRPLPLRDIDPFKPFLYGDYVWDSTTKFVEFAGMEHLRAPRATALLA
jgi:isopenicillin N synthase-like dioxygenase